MSVKNCFEKFADSAAIQFVQDNDTNTLIVEDVGDADLNLLVPLIKRYALQLEIAKISIKVKESSAIYFFQHGFKVEASIMAYYGLQDAFYIAYYLKGAYFDNQFEAQHNAILDASFNINNEPIMDLDDIKISSGFIKPSIDGDHQLVFSGREAPASPNDEINKFCAQIGNKIVASVNAHHCRKRKVVAFSDFIIDSALEPKNVINQLLNEMESYYAFIDCKTAYTTVPASSLMINTVCAGNNFEFGGRLTNESVFKGKLDSLNTWFKQL